MSRPARPAWTGDAILLDLFGTVVHFAPEVPTIRVGGAVRRTTMPWLRDAAAREVPEVEFAALTDALLAVTRELVLERPPEYREVPSRERFRRALERVGVADTRRGPLAETLSLAHMGHLASLTCVPAGHLEVLRAVQARYRLGLVSNFDHGPTARRILAAHGVDRFFEVIVISEEVGRRKPHPTVFLDAVARLGSRPGATLFVGDSATEDVAGAHAAGLPVAWLNPQGEALPDGVPAPDFTLAALPDLPALVLRG